MYRSGDRQREFGVRGGPYTGAPITLATKDLPRETRELLSAALVGRGKDGPIASSGPPLGARRVAFVVLAAGVLPIRKTLTLRAGEKRPLEIDAAAPAGGGSSGGGQGVAPNGDTGTRAKGSSKPWALPVAIAGGAVGVAGMVTFTIAGIASQNTYNDLKSKCGTSPCPANLAGEVSSGKTQQAVANTGLALGLIGLAVGGTFLVIWLVSPKASASTSASLVVGPGSLGFAGTF